MVRKGTKKVKRIKVVPVLLDAVANLQSRKAFPRFWACNKQQRAFVFHYTIGPTRGNANASARAAGYSVKYGGGNGSGGGWQVQRSAKVQLAIGELINVSPIDPAYVAEKIQEQLAGVDVADLEAYQDGTKTLTQLRAEGVNTAALLKAVVTVDKSGDMRRTVERVNPMSVLRLAADVAGMIKQQRTVEHTHRFEVFLANATEEQKRRIAHATRQIELEPTPIDVQYQLSTRQETVNIDRKNEEAG